MRSYQGRNIWDDPIIEKSERVIISGPGPGSGSGPGPEMAAAQRAAAADGPGPDPDPGPENFQFFKFLRKSFKNNKK